ncbi:MAG: hypothetical protein ACOYON_08245 [Fimbriimonas sp.]
MSSLSTLSPAPIVDRSIQFETTQKKGEGSFARTGPSLGAQPPTGVIRIDSDTVVVGPSASGSSTAARTDSPVAALAETPPSNNSVLLVGSVLAGIGCLVAVFFFAEKKHARLAK